jgi:hypothetical protein
MTREDCNDVVSRKAVINLILEDAVRTGTGHRYTSIQNMNNEINEVRSLPPVIPTRKEGMQDSILDKIKAEIAMYEADCRLSGDEEPCKQCTDNVFGSIYRIIDKYKAGE